MTKEEKHPTPGADEKVRPTRRLIIIGACIALVAAAVVAGRLAGAPSETPAASEPQSEETPAEAEDPASDADDVASAISTLALEGTDLSVPASDVTVSIEGGRVLVTQASADDAATMVEKTAKRAAALASESASADTTLVDSASAVSAPPSASASETAETDVATETPATSSDASTASGFDQGSSAATASEFRDVTWVATDSSGNVQVVVEYKGGEEVHASDTAGAAVDKSAGHDMTDAAYDSIGGEASGTTKTGGETVTDLDGVTITPAPSMPPDQPAAATDEETTPVTTEPSSTSAPAESTSTPTGSTDEPSSQRTPTYHTVTVVDTPAWDETVVDTPAWDETVTVSDGYSTWVASDGTEFTSLSACNTYCHAHDCSNSVVWHPPVTKTVHHDAVTHTEQVAD